MDLTPTIIPKSDQVNADDLIAGPATVTIVEVTKGTTDQPVNIVTQEFGPKRPYKPAKSMRRLMVSAWGPDTSTYPGRQLTIYRDPHVKFGGEEVGGIRISAMSHLAEPLTVSLTVTRGKRHKVTVQPIAGEPVRDESGRDWLTELAQADGDVDAIGALGKAASEAHAAGTILAVIRQAWRDAQNVEVEP